MPRKFIIFICCLNALLGFGALWLILNPNKQLLNKDLQPPSTSAAREYSDETLWALAEDAATARQAYGHLDRLSRSRATLGVMAQRIEAMAGPSPLPYAQWPFVEAMLLNYGSRAESAKDLRPLARVAGQAEQALTLRDTAFRSFIENLGRFEAIRDPAPPALEELRRTGDAGLLRESPSPSDGGAVGGDAYALIDLLHGEVNGLAGTALLAEHYLMQKGYKREDGRPGGGR